MAVCARGCLEEREGPGCEFVLLDESYFIFAVEKVSILHTQYTPGWGKGMNAWFGYHHVI